jgi:hypothetical protein
MSALGQAKFDREHGISSIIETLGGRHVTQIFVHDVTSWKYLAEIAAIVSGLEKYDERALVFARPHDIVCVACRPEKRYLQFLSTLGIGPKDGNVILASKGALSRPGAILPDLLIGNHKVLSDIGKLVKANNEVVLNPFVASSGQFKLASAMETILGRRLRVLGGRSDIVDYAIGKHNVRAKAIELGVPVPEGDVVELKLGKDGMPLDLSPIEVGINKHIDKTGMVIIKGAYGASGSSTWIVENNSDSVRQALSKIAEKSDSRIYLIEVMLDVIVSPNILMYIEPGSGRISCVSVTEQILTEELVHEGNVYPPSAKTVKSMMSSARKISGWLAAEGYTGFVGFDFAEYLCMETNDLTYFFAEINPRINAAAYPKALMDRLNMQRGQQGRPYIEAFLSANMKTKATSFAQLNELYGHSFFKSETGKGSVPYNTGCLKYGKFSLAVFGKSRNEVTQMYEDFKRWTHAERAS